MADVPRVAVRPPVRCGFTDGSWPAPVCAAPASHRRLVAGVHVPRFFCGAHALPTDQPIADEDLFCLVSATLDVHFCGVSWIPAVAHAEVLTRLELALASVGGVINLHACRSMLARARPSPPIGPQKGGRGREQ